MAYLTRTRNEIRKRRSRKGVSVLMSLPKDLLLEVIAKVASNSFDDLCRIRQSCKEFNKAGQHDYIFEHVSMDKFPFIPLRRREEFSEFLGRCGKCGNAEALYRQGVVQLFNSKEFDFESGFECLKKAAAKGHKEAMYVYGVFLACVGGHEARQQGVPCLSSLTRADLSESRERTMTCIQSMWVNNVIVGTMLACNARVRTCGLCGNVQDNFVSKRGWDDLYDETDNLNGCDSCKMNRQVNIFCDGLRGYTTVNLA